MKLLHFCEMAVQCTVADGVVPAMMRICHFPAGEKAAWVSAPDGFQGKDSNFGLVLVTILAMMRT